MPAPTEENYVDTNVVIECHRIGCWNALAGGSRLTTVHKVIEECGAGAGRRKGYVTVDIENVKNRVQCCAVLNQDLAGLRLQLAGRVSLDPGEEHLLAKAVTERGSWKICSPDKALIRASWILGYLERVISLESLLQKIGFSPRVTLQNQYTERWLSQIRTDLLLEGI
ncbi:MAG: hypothetical protein ACOYMS_08430 [Terrimicrobiaceae bacterium]